MTHLARCGSAQLCRSRARTPRWPRVTRPGSRSCGAHRPAWPCSAARRGEMMRSFSPIRNHDGTCFHSGCSPDGSTSASWVAGRCVVPSLRPAARGRPRRTCRGSGPERRRSHSFRRCAGPAAPSPRRRTSQAGQRRRAAAIPRRLRRRRTNRRSHNARTTPGCPCRHEPTTRHRGIVLARHARITHAKAWRSRSLAGSKRSFAPPAG
jgi:hypothetical protein